MKQYKVIREMAAPTGIWNVGNIIAEEKIIKEFSLELLEYMVREKWLELIPENKMQIVEGKDLKTLLLLNVKNEFIQTADDDLYIRNADDQTRSILKAIEGVRCMRGIVHLIESEVQNG